MQSKFILQSAMLPNGWAKDVFLEVDHGGNVIQLQPDTVSSESAQKVNGAVIPGIPNCHSHAHQRAMAGLGEKASIEGGKKATDSFWTWRVAMYHYLQRIKPEDLYTIAKMLYLEMLKAGYTNIAEFQYLHHDLNGNAYANRAEMTLQCMQAAADVGIGFTALPVLYQYGGFGSQPALEGQKRFLNDAEGFCRIVENLFIAAKDSGNDASVGIAPHSLRAISEELLSEVIDSLSTKPLAAIHVHVAEQTKEVDDCLQWSKQRPVQWMMDRFDVDHNWCAIHATHMDEMETMKLAQSGAVAGLCPTTEGNLGDGFFNFVDFTDHNGCWAIGSDSHISISAVEELRWLEYGQRLFYRQRNIAAQSATANTGTALLKSALQGGGQSSGRNIGQLEIGSRADFVVLDTMHPRLFGRTEDDLIDSWIFSGNENSVKDVYIGGKKVIDNGQHEQQEYIESEFRNVISQLSDS